MTEQLPLFDLPEVEEADIEKPHSVCPKCGCKHIKTSSNSTSYCRPCRLYHAKILSVLRKTNPTPTEEDYCCNICGKQEKDISAHFGKHGVKKTVWRLDHDHDTGEFRGFLCDNCNVGVGKFGDDPETILNALRYVKTNNGIAEMSDQHLAEWCYNILSNSS